MLVFVSVSHPERGEIQVISPPWGYLPIPFIQSARQSIGYALSRRTFRCAVLVVIGTRMCDRRVI